MVRCLLLGVIVIATAPPLSADDPKPAADSDSHEKVVKDMLAMLKAATKIFTDAKDADTAKKAKPEVEKLASSMQGINDRNAKLGALAKPQEAELEKKFKTELDDTIKSYQAQVQRLLKESWGKDLVTILQKKPAPKAK